MTILLLILFPIFELYLFIAIGSEIGALTTVLWTLLSLFIGSTIVKYQGLSNLSNCYRSMNDGQNPVRAMADEFAIVLGGALLFLPGFLTDFLGLLCLLPPTRYLLFKAINYGFAHRTVRIRTYSFRQGKAQRPRPDSKPDNVIEGEYRRKQK